MFIQPDWFFKTLSSSSTFAFPPEWLHSAVYGGAGESPGSGAVPTGQRLQSEHRHRGKETHEQTDNVHAVSGLFTHTHIH